MYKLTYKGQFVDGFDTDQVVGNLAQLLNLKPKAVRLAFLSGRPSVIKLLDSASEVERWCAAFQDAGVYLDVANVTPGDAENIAGQIELDLDLHEMDVEDEEPDERHYLIRKVMTPEPDAEPQTFYNQPLATRPIIDYAATPEAPSSAPLAAAAGDKPADNKTANAAPAPQHKTTQSPSRVGEAASAAATKSKTVDNHVINGMVLNGQSHAENEKRPNGVHKAEGAANGVHTNGSHANGKVNGSHEPINSSRNGSHASVVATTDPIEINTAASGKSKTRAGQESASASASAVTVQDLSVANIDALVAQQTLDPQQSPEESEINQSVAAATSPPAATYTKTAPVATRQPATQRDYEPETADDAALNELHESHLTQAAEDEEELLEDINFHKSHFVWGMLVILLAIIVTAGTILWLKRSTWTPVAVAPHESKVNEAIASASLFGLIHVDVDRVRMLSPTTDVISQLAEPQPGFWQSLSAAGIDLHQQIDDAWLGAYGQNGQTKMLWVLHGNFAAPAWRDWLKKNYIIDGDSPEGIIFSTIDDNTCEKSPVLSASIGNKQIVLGAPELVATFNGRLQAGAAAGKNLETWAKGYNTQMISAVLFQPGQLPEGSAAMALGKLSLPAEPIQGIYLGLEPKTFPPTVKFNAVIESTNQDFIADTANKLTAATALAKTTIANDWPETLPLYENLKITQQANQLHAVINMDEQAPKHLQLWVSSLLSRAFAPNIPAPEVVEERLETNPPQFNNLPSAELPAFTSVKHFNEAFIAQTSSGPFGIGIRAVEETDQGVEINLDVNAFNLPNLGKESDSVSLRITDVVDHQDKSLLADNGGCGEDVKRPVNVNLVYQGNAMDNGQIIGFTGLQGAKKILLPAGMALSSVGAVKGVIAHQLPTNVERVNVNSPLVGKTLDVHGVQLRFLAAGPNRLHFQVSGNTAALLQVNALNEDGNVLASSNAVRGDNPFNAGKTVSIDYQGDIAAAEIIVASKLEQKNYEFSVARLFPPAKPFVTEKPEPAHLSAASLPALEKDSPPNDVIYPYQTPKQTIAAGPALIALNDLVISGQQLSLAADVYTRNSHPLVGQLSAVRLMLTEVEDSSGNLHSVNYQSPITMEHMGGSWIDGKFEADPGRPWLRGQLEMRELPLEQTDAVALWGKLVFLATEDPVSIKVPFQFGMQWNSNDGILKLRRWEASRLIFDIEGNFPGLMAVKALDDVGEVVSQPAELRNSFGKKTIELEVKQIPETIEFNIARTQNPKEFPVEIRVLQ